MPLPFSITAGSRPNRLTADKDEKYHCDFARYCGSSLNNPMLIQYYYRIFRNRAFYLGMQWDRDKDTTFLEDSNGESRGRIPTVDNMIRPYVNQLINEATEMSLNFKARSEGDRVINRREKELARMKVGRTISDLHPNLTPMVKKQMPIGRDMNETEEIFRNVYVDKYTKTINNLIKYIANANDLDTVIRHKEAESMAINGMGIIFNTCINGELVPRTIDPEDFFFDTGAKKFDLSDAEYKGHLEYALPTDLYERYNISEETKKKIENYTKNLPTQATLLPSMPYTYPNIPGRIPKIYAEWCDSERYVYGYVKDQFGYEMFTRVYSNDYKPKNNERIYHEKDLIKPQTDIRKNLMNGKLKKTITTEVQRYCIFTPAEYFADDKGKDIVYEYGLVPYQETYALNPTKVESSYRCSCWGYHDGYISSPLDDIIDPQRLVNRYRSMAESKANKDTAGIAIDEWALNGQNIDAAEQQRKVERGETITLNSRGGGIPNSIIEYGAKLASTAQVFTAMANEEVVIMQQRTGILNIPPKAAKKVLMGLEAEEQSLHGLYLSRIVNLFEQEYQCLGNKGKRIYADSPRRLAIMVGDEGAEEIRITKDMVLEDFRIKITRQDDEKQSKQLANQTLSQLLQMQAITKEDFADNYDRITLDEVGSVIRDSLIRTQTAQKAQAQAQQQQQQQQQMLMQATIERQELQKEKDKGTELNEAQKDRMAKLDQIIMRAKAKIEVDTNKHQLKLSEMAHENKSE